MKKKVFFVFLILLFLFLVWWFFLKGSKKAERVTAIVTKEDVTSSISLSGKVKAINESSLSFPISGKLIKIASESSNVKEGEVLALLDTSDLYAAYASALATLNKARSTYSNAVEAKAELDATYAGLESNNTVKAKLAEGKTSVEAAAASVDVYKFAADQSYANLAKAVMRAPFSGTVVDSMSKVGEIAAASVAVIRLADLSSFYFEADADEVDVGNLRIGQEASVKLDAFSGGEFKGTLTYMAIFSHTTSSGGTAYKVKIQINDNSCTAFRSGMNGEAEVFGEVRKGILTVPSAFVFQKGGKNMVLTKGPSGNTTEQEVSIGDLVNGKYEITAGLKVDQIIVRDITK